MTIHSDWSRIFHEECPDAFHTTKVPYKDPKVGIIDGHLQLMCLHKGLASWEAFVQYLFVKPILQLYQAGCPRVVLCFDCYDNVPIYKSMTQTKRTMKKEVCVFDPSHGLPPHIPHDPMLFLMNRDFKLKVIEMVCERLPAMLLPQLKLPQELIVDYKRVVVYSHLGGIPRLLEGLNPMGESDVKFCRYVDLYGSALVHAIDGDYLAIALLYYTKAAVFDKSNRIHIYRQLSTFHAQPNNKPVAAAKRKVVKCWVDIQMLYLTIVNAVKQSGHHDGALLDVHTSRPFTHSDMVHSAVFLMLLAGTDFSRPLPWLGPKRLWDNLPHIVHSLLQTTTIPSTAAEDNDDATMMMPIIMDDSPDLVISKIYRLVFSKHCSGSGGSLRATLHTLQQSKLSDSVKSKFPSEDQVSTTVQNIAWVMSYWKTHNGSIAVPLDGSNGYVRCPRSRQITFSDHPF